jgi:hypothetical protein
MIMATYHPPKTLTRTIAQIIRLIDPNWKPPLTGKEVEFEFSNGRKFEANRGDRHPYDIEE